MKSPLLAVAWTRFQPRTVAIAAALGGEARFLDDRLTGSSIAARPLAYVSKAWRLWRMLAREQPQSVLVITPPVFAPLVAWAWCRVHRRRLIVDCHTGAFHSNRWAWARPIHRRVLRHATAVLLHTEELEELVRGWGAPAMLVPDDLPEAADAAPQLRHEGDCVLVAGSLDANEPVAVAVEAARLQPDVRFRFTGDTRHVAPQIVEQAPANVTFTGYLEYAAFLGEMLVADVVAVFSTDPRIMNRAAFEAVGLGRPLVLSDLPALKSRFGDGPLMCANDPKAMADAVLEALRQRDELAARSVALQTRLKAQRAQAIARLQSIVDVGMEPLWRQRSAS